MDLLWSRMNKGKAKRKRLGMKSETLLLLLRTWMKRMPHHMSPSQLVCCPYLMETKLKSPFAETLLSLSQRLLHRRKFHRSYQNGDLMGRKNNNQKKPDSKNKKEKNKGNEQTKAISPRVARLYDHRQWQLTFQ